MENERYAIDDDPTLEAVLYAPSNRINASLTSIFYKNCIASGSIVSSIGESARVRNSDWWTGICVICIVSLGIVAFAAAALIRW